MREERGAGKGEPFSIRLSRPTERFVEAEAKRTRRSKSTVVESLTEEAARMRTFPGIAFRGDDAGRRPWLIGTGFDIWEVIQAVQDARGSEALLASDVGITPMHIRLAVAYYEQHPADIDDAIEENRRPAQEWKELYPFLVVEHLDV